MTDLSRWCDGGNPCRRCAIKGRECSPYSRDFLFVQQSSNKEGRALKGENTAGSTSRDQSTLHAGNVADGGSPLAAIFEQYTMNNVAYSDQLISHFLQGYTADATRRADVAGLPSSTWILRLPAMRGQSRVLDMAAWALSSAGLARECHDLTLLRSASAAYGKA